MMSEPCLVGVDGWKRAGLDNWVSECWVWPVSLNSLELEALSLPIAPDLGHMGEKTPMGSLGSCLTV